MRTNAVGHTLSLAGLAVFAVLAAGSYDSDSGGDTSGGTETTAMATTPEVGDEANGRYFTYVVNEVSRSLSVETDNRYTSLAESPGNQYLIIDVTITNSDDEGRMVFEGSLWIESEGKKLQFDKTEMLLGDGWGFRMTTLNPMVSETSKIVWKIPANIEGDLYWQPGREDRNFRISLGYLPL